MNAPILQMQGIEKRFPGVRALRGVDLEVAAGEVVALVGENGAGKSTLMKIIGGLHQPDEGRLLFDGTPTVITSVAQAIRLGVSFIHQELNVLGNLDVAGNIYLGREPLRGGPLRIIDRRRLYAETTALLKRLGLNIESHTPLAELSIAQQQMVEIAKALSLDARILIMDEPTSSLTLAETHRLLEVVKDLRTHGVGIIYISHRLGEVEEIADRVVVLRDGANAGNLARHEITHDQMVRMMVGRNLEKIIAHPASANVADAPPVMIVENLSTNRYPEEKVSFSIKRGEILGLSGLVGAGRSEMAQAIFGAEGALRGKVSLNDKLLRIAAPRDAIKHGIFLVPEDRRRLGLLVDLPIRENVTMPALERYSSVGIIAKDRERQAARTVCEQLNVKTPSVEERVANLSGGNQQKVVLAKWLSLNPQVLIFDEPTRGIDVGAKTEIYELMRSLADQGVGVLMISSDMEEVLRISDRVAVMHEGKITGILEREQCSEEAIMRLAVGATNN